MTLLLFYKWDNEERPINFQVIASKGFQEKLQKKKTRKEWATKKKY